jgi:DNA end-binding protein Ku
VLGFGLVSIPVRLMPASRAGGGLSLHLLHADDHGRILNKHVCELDGAEVPWSRIVRGYEYERGHYAIVTDEELAGLNPETTQTIDIVQFADASEVDIMLYDRPYYVSPEKRGKHAYALLRSTLGSSGKVGIVRVVLRTREHLAVLKSHGDALVLVLLRYADEILGDPGIELPPQNERASEAERRVARTLLEEMTAPFDIGAFHDTQHEQLEKLLAQRGRGKKVPAPKAPPATNLVDLASVLERSLSAAKNRPKPAGSNAARSLGGQ